MAVVDSLGSTPASPGFDDAALAAALAEAQRLGFLGARPVGEAIEHARSVVVALDGVSGRVVDLGAGGGLPGLVIAQTRPDLALTLIDRRTKRTDFLERVVRRHRLGDRVRVLPDDVEHLVGRVASGEEARFDAAVARGFGPPEQTLSFMAALGAPGASLVITEPPVGDRWDPALLDAVGVRRVAAPDGVAVFEVSHAPEP